MAAVLAQAHRFAVEMTLRRRAQLVSVRSAHLTGYDATEIAYTDVQRIEVDPCQRPTMASRRCRRQTATGSVNDGRRPAMGSQSKTLDSRRSTETAAASAASKVAAPVSATGRHVCHTSQAQHASTRSTTSTSNNGLTLNSLSKLTTSRKVWWRWLVWTLTGKHRSRFELRGKRAVRRSSDATTNHTHNMQWSDDLEQIHNNISNHISGREVFLKLPVSLHSHSIGCYSIVFLLVGCGVNLIFKR